MSLATRTAALLDLVEADRAARCAAIVGEARAQAVALVAGARAEARARLHEALDDERSRARQQVGAAMAALQTQRRLHEQRRTAALLALARQLLPEGLRARWADAAARERWVAQAMDGALELFAAREWTIRHAAGWPAPEREALAHRYAAGHGRTLRFEPDANAVAGLAIAAGANRLDFTLAGLLADDDEIGSRLVGMIEELP